MKRSFFAPILFLGVMMMLGGYGGIWMNFKTVETRNADLTDFIARYQDADDYDALFNKGCKIQKEVIFLQSEYTTFPASSAFLGLYLILWAFDRRKMFKKFKEMQQRIVNNSPENSLKPDA